MERWSVQQRIFCVEKFVLSKSIVSVQREFRRKLVMIGNVGLYLQEK